MASGNVVVAVRCRPLNSRERTRGASCLVSMDGQQTTLEQPAADTKTAVGRKRRTFTFDHSFWTAGDACSPKYASQEAVFGDIGQAVLKHALAGYHCCVFAYGQTGSGKSYTMMGTGTDPGLIPRICQQLFASISASTGLSYHVEVSYLEIYNERVRDLLNPGSSGKSLRVREHPALGPYVEDLTMAAVSSYEEIFEHMSQGNKARTVAATNMNEASSRSHAVFTITLTMRTHAVGVAERVSRVRLVDLAGSERANSTQAAGARLKEGAKINQSLGSLGKVISALASQSRNHSTEFVPYRDSVLTWLLKDSLGGNSRTFMIATISPADFSETLSTLRYADRAKHIVNQATVNEDATVRLVRELKEEVAGLRQRLALAGSSGTVGGDLEDQLRANEKLMAELNQTWEQKLARTQAVQADREKALAALGIAIDTNQAGLGVGIHAPRDIPHLVNLSEDPLMSECLVYNLKPGHTTVGSGDDVDIKLSALRGVHPRHCFFEHCTDGSGGVAVHPIDGALVLVNGRPIGLPRVLRSGYRVIIGTSFVFRFNHPQQARQELLGADTPGLEPSSDGVPESESAAADWNDAWMEAHPDSTLSGSELNSTPLADYSPSLWSDSMSEFSDITDSPSNPRSVAAVPMSKLSASLRGRAMSLSQRQRRNSAMAPEDHPASYDPRRARGQSVSGLQQSTVTVDERRSSEKHLASLVAQQWRRYKLMRVGQTILQNAIHLKEANVISKELGQKAVYQFAILRGGFEAHPISPLELDALPALLSDWDSISISDRRSTRALHPLFESSVPRVVVKVLDIANTCWYVWSLDEFLGRLDKMRRLSTVKGSYRAHLVLEPFHAHPSPRFSCIGSAVYPIWPGQRPYSARIDAPVVDSLSGMERGRVLGSLAALPIRNSTGRWSLIVHVKSLHGVTEAEMTSVHCRLRLARIHGLLSATDTLPTERPLSSLSHRSDCSADLLQPQVTSDVSRFHSTPLSGFGDGPVNIHFRQQWTVDLLTEDTCVIIEFFAAAQPPALRRAFHEDVQIEQSLRAPPGVPRQSSFITGAPPLSASQNLLVERLHEEELFVDSQHELILWIRVLELGLDGQWERAPWSSAFLLRQGLQRRVLLCIGHNSSQHLRITRVAELSVGRPTLVDDKGRAVAQCSSPGMARLPTVDEKLDAGEGRVDNRCFVMATMPWDTSVYGSSLLDQPTDRGMYVRLSMALKLEIENGEAPIELHTEILAQVHSRQSTAGRLSWLSALTENASGMIRSGLKITPPQVEEFAPLVDPVFRVFSVTLSPIHVAGKGDLWRLNTGKKYVRGEETLLPWQPRSVQYVDEFHRWEHVEAWRLLVARSRVLLEALGPCQESSEDVAVVRQLLEGGPGRLLTLRQERIRRRVLEAVRKISSFRCVPDIGLGLQQEPVQSTVESTELLDRSVARRVPRMVRPVHMQGHFCYRGWVDLLDTNAGPDRWARRWLVVERPYIFVFATSECLFLENVINIASARVSVDNHVSEMLGRQGVLALYTNTNAYLLSPPVDEIQKWISAIDNWFYIL